MHRSLLLSLLFLCLMSFVSSVYADDEADNVNIMDLPSKLSDAIGVPVFASQLLISSIFLFAFLLPCSIWGGENPLPTIIIGFCIMGFLIAVSWMPYWFLFVIALIIALMFGGRMKDWVTSGG